MLPGNQAVAEVVSRRIDELIAYGSAAARSLVEEEDVLLRTLGWYQERESANSLAQAMDERLQAVRSELDHVLPLWEEAQLLMRVLRYYKREEAGEQDPGRLGVLRNQIRHQLDVERRQARSRTSPVEGPVRLEARQHWSPPVAAPA